MPDPISWWPPAIGWWLLVIIAIISLWIAWKLVAWGLRMINQNRIKKLILKEVDSIQSVYDQTKDIKHAVESLSILMRRVAITRFNEPGIAGKIGKDRLKWMCERTEGDFDQEVLQLLEQVPYEKTPRLDPVPLLTECRRWIEQVVKQPAYRHD